MFVGNLNIRKPHNRQTEKDFLIHSLLHPQIPDLSYLSFFFGFSNVLLCSSCRKRCTLLHLRRFLDRKKLLRLCPPTRYCCLIWVRLHFRVSALSFFIFRKLFSSHNSSSRITRRFVKVFPTFPKMCACCVTSESFCTLYNMTYILRAFCGIFIKIMISQMLGRLDQRLP